MKKYLLVDATAEQISLEDAKTHLRVFDNDDDLYIQGLIATARIVAEKHTGNRYGLQTIKTVFSKEDGICGNVSLEKPCQSVESIILTFDDETTESFADYKIRDEKIFLGSLPSFLTMEVTQISGKNAPSPVKSAILLLIGHLYENREAVIDTKTYVLQYGVTNLLNTDLEVL